MHRACQIRGTAYSFPYEIEFYVSLKDGKIVTNGGRVLGVTALGDGIKMAIDRAYEAVSKITWSGGHYRKDIGRRALKFYK